MGEVWKARDTRLDRIVAIKRLQERHSARFEQEARTIAGSGVKPQPSFGPIRDTVTGGTFFTPGTAFQMRQLQFALKYIF